MNPDLNLPKFELKIKENEIWDCLRLKYVKLTPEEWVRQNFIYYLMSLGYSKNLMQSEKLVKYNSLNKRCDIIVYDNFGNPQIIVECKAPKIKLSKDTFYQIAKYQSTIKATLLILTNGLQHINAILNHKTQAISIIKETPSISELESLRSNF